MDFERFFKFQLVIDDLRSSKKKVSNRLKGVVLTPLVSDFLIFKKLNVLELAEFSRLVKLKINKKMVIESLECCKHQFINKDFCYKLPIKYLQRISDFIDDHKDILTDYEYRYDLEYLASFY